MGTTLEVAGVSGSAQLAEILARCADAGAPPAAVRFRDGRAWLDLTPHGVSDELAEDLARLGLAIEVGPADVPFAQLSDRERALVAGLAAGLQMKEVAFRMGITTNTVREYWIRAKRKLGVRSVGEAAALWALECAWCGAALERGAADATIQRAAA
ncbi:MAG TPA: helix-turn-helix transcriptional regulator [Capillimicrobium sp.]|nr:helix-turn-helix transcriptional regulator [Capillimicrobium sp.]